MQEGVIRWGRPPHYLDVSPCALRNSRIKREGLQTRPVGGQTLDKVDVALAGLVLLGIFTQTLVVDGEGDNLGLLELEPIDRHLGWKTDINIILLPYISDTWFVLERGTLFLLFFSSLNLQPWGLGHTERPSLGSEWWSHPWFWPDPLSSLQHQSDKLCSAPWPPPPANRGRSISMMNLRIGRQV